MNRGVVDTFRRPSTTPRRYPSSQVPSIGVGRVSTKSGGREPGGLNPLNDSKGLRVKGKNKEKNFGKNIVEITLH